VEHIEEVVAGGVDQDEGVDFLALGLRSVVMNAELSKFLYERCAVDVEVSDGELWCWRAGCNILWFFVVVAMCVVDVW
jgi:hypothetical protein